MSGVDGGGLSAEEREALMVWDSGAYSCACEGTCSSVPCENDRDDLPATVERIVAARVAAAEQRAADIGRRATLDPGAFVKRGPDNDGYAYGEPLDRWQRRAIAAALADPTPREKRPWCLCMPGIGPHDDGCPAADPTPRDDDGGPRVREAAERAERDAEVRAADVWFRKRLAVAATSDWTAEDYSDLCDGMVRRLSAALDGDGDE